MDEQKYCHLATCNITNNLSTEESEGYTQFLQALIIQLDINMDQDHEDFKDHKQEEEEEEENRPPKKPPVKVEDLPEEPKWSEEQN